MQILSSSEFYGTHYLPLSVKYFSRFQGSPGGLGLTNRAKGFGGADKEVLGLLGLSGDPVGAGAGATTAFAALPA